ncbi:MAG: DUF378 domain-containing protein [Candidatus Paceibacterota bacterium]
MCNHKCASSCSLRKLRKVLLIVGGLNWGLVGVGMLMNIDLNVVHMLVGFWPMLEAVVYILVGLAAVLKIFGCRCKKCMEACASCCAFPEKGDMSQKM